MRLITLAVLCLSIVALAADELTAPKRVPYIYKAKVVEVIDGDTVKVDIDLGLHVWLHDQAIRLHGINAPELTPKKPAKSWTADKLAAWQASPGYAAKTALQALIDEGKGEIVIQTIKDESDKYGRWLGVIWCGKDGAVNAGRYLVASGKAAEWNGEGEKPLP